MIPLAKHPKPQVLVDHADEWTKTLIDRQAAGEKPTQTEATRYRHPDVKRALVAETHNKCAYCESKLQHIHHGDVEHVMPKSLEPNRVLEWDNLTLACEICNQRKSNLDPNAERLIDPYDKNPAEHLVFAGAFIFAIGTPEGISTRVTLDLDRPELIEMRKERVKALMAIYSEAMRQDVPLRARRLIYQSLLRDELADDKAYAGMARDLLSQLASRTPDELK